MKATAVNNLGKLEKNKKILEGNCIFPFKYKKKIHNECFDDGKGEICATEINEKTQTLKKYGYCNSKTKTQKLRKSQLKLTSLKSPKKQLDIETKTKQKTIKTTNRMTRKLKIVDSLKPKQYRKQTMDNLKVYNEEFVLVLSELEDIMARQGEPFRSRAYQKAAETIMAYSQPITNPSQLKGMPGIGTTIMSKLEEYVETGKLKAIEKYRNSPLNILTKVYGIGPKKAKQLISQGIDTIDKLKENIEDLTSAQKLGVEYYDDINKRIPRSEIDEYKKKIDDVFEKTTPDGTRYEIVGSYRRGAKTSGDIDIIITNDENNTKSLSDFLNALVTDKIITHVLSKGKTKSLTIAQLPGKPARRVDLMYAPPKEYSFAILYFTGSKAFNTVQRQRALNLGYTLNEHGFSVMKDGKKENPIDGDFPDEKSIFNFLNMKYKKPEERIDGRSVELNEKNTIEKNTIEKNSKSNKKTTLKKRVKVNDDKEKIRDFKKGGVGFLKTLTEAQLSKMIKTANDAYYCEGSSVMSDDQYDILREYTLDKYPENEMAKAGHTACDMIIQKNKVKLPYEMWSMDKIKPDSNALPKWSKKYKGPYVLSCKLDGVSGLYTTEGEYAMLYTRGNGKIGQDVSHMIPYLRLPTEKGIVIRGEFIIQKQVFSEKYSTEFANPRNFVAGVVNQKKIVLEKLKDIDFVAYEVIKPEMKPSEQFLFLNKQNVETVKYLVEKNISNENMSELLVEWRKNYKYEIDGVICANDEIYKRTSGNPEHAFAFKMVLSDQIAEVKVVDVIWTASKDGYLKPRVQVEPITLGGVKIEYATGFNAKFIDDNKIGVGALIKLVRSGDVIPHILEVVRPAPEALMPSVLYKWNNTRVDILLLDKSADKTVQEKVITGFFKGISVDGMGEGIVKRIISAGYDSVPKILAMSKENFLEIDGFKEKLATKIYNNIREKLETASLAKLMHATNIFGRGFGEKRLVSILDKYPKILVSDESNVDKEILLGDVSGIAKKSAMLFVEKIPEFVKWANEAKVSKRLVYEKPKLSTLVKDNILYGKSIVMTGFRDKELSDKIEKYGAKIGSSVSKNTFVLLVKDIDENTGKAEQARKLDITIMTPEMFKTKYNI